MESSTSPFLTGCLVYSPRTWGSCGRERKGSTRQAVPRETSASRESFKSFGLRKMIVFTLAATCAVPPRAYPGLCIAPNGHKQLASLIDDPVQQRLFLLCDGSVSPSP